MDDWASPGPSVDGDTVYTGSQYGDGSVYALGVYDGEKHWQVKFGTITIHTPTAGEDAVYVSASDLHALSKADGEEIWNFSDFEPFEGASSSPVVSSNAIYVGSDNPNEETSSVYAINRDGSFRWRFNQGSNTFGNTPVVSQGMVYFSNSGDNPPELFALDADTGDEIWRFIPEGEGAIRAPAVANGLVYASGVNDVYALEAESGGIRWQREINPDTPPTVADGQIFLSVNKKVLALDASNGKMRWELESDVFHLSPPVLADSVGFTRANKNQKVVLYALSG